MKRRLKIDGFLAVTLTVVLVYLTHLFYKPKNKILDYALDAAGMILVIFGQILRISARNYKKQHSNQGGILITGGPYDLVRNPMYLGTFLMGAGFVTILWPWWFLLVYVGIFYLRFRKLVLSEEDKLSGIFGKSYQEYLRAVPAFIPPLNKLGNLPGYLPLQWKWIKKELSAIATWLVLVAIIEGLVEKEGFASLEYLKELMVLAGSFIVVSAGFILILMKNGPAKNS
jgi:protein-S-isoprenylcysteine O-methyltransferase Ste14